MIGKTGDLLGHNLFTYCKNNPVNMVDNNGQFAWFIPIGIFIAEFIEEIIISVLTLATIREAGKLISSSSSSKTSGKSIPNRKNTAEKAKAKGVPRDDHSVVPHSLGAKNPNEGRPNSSSDLLNEDGSVKQRRYYGPDYKPELDIDFSHQGQETHVFPHSHTWDWSLPKPRLKWEPWMPK